MTRAAFRPFRTIKGACDVYVGHGILPRVGEIEAARRATGIAVVADRTTDRLFRAAIEKTVRSDERGFTRASFPPGEASKRLRTVESLLELLVKARLDRGAVVVAVGGGVVTDVGGLVASLFLRGVPWIAVPTTLLGMVDASIGGKTGVDLKFGKNLAGTFHPPAAVVADLDTLSSLPRRERSSGLAEVVKIALATDRAFFETIEKTGAKLLDGDLEPIVRRAIELKADLVERDERDAGARLALNLGHTAGHALEAATSYGRFLHGEAVSVGLRVACELAVARKKLAPEIAARVARLIAKLGLPYRWPDDLAPLETLKYVQADKKSAAGQLRFVLPVGLGAVEITPASLEELASAAERARRATAGA